MLEAHDLHKNFGGVIAVDGVSLSLRAGEVVGLVGHNGSGKTTLLDILRGRVKPDKGLVLIDGKVLYDRAFLGLNGTAAKVFRSYQVPRLFPAHSVSENLLLGKWGIGNGTHPPDDIGSIISTLPDSSQLAGTLSVGQRRRLILSWLYQRLDSVKYFLLDEPSAGGDAEYVKAILGFIHTARSKGKGVLIVEHNQQILSAVADRLLLMATGRCHEVTTLPPPLSKPARVAPNTPGRDSGFRCKDITVRRGGATIINKLSLSVAPGEVLGVMGANGCGKSTLLLALYGDPTCSYPEGTIWDDADELPAQSLDSRIRRGIHLLPQEGGTFKSMTVAETLQASIESCCHSRLSADKIKDVAWKVPHVERVWQRRCGALSGGERRLVGLARVLILNPRYALLDEPSAGLDEEAKTRVALLIRELASQGAGILIAEQDKGFIESFCSRLTYLDSR